MILNYETVTFSNYREVHLLRQRPSEDPALQGSDSVHAEHDPEPVPRGDDVPVRCRGGGAGEQGIHGGQGLPALDIHRKLTTLRSKNTVIVPESNSWTIWQLFL